MIFICAVSLPVHGICYYRLHYCGSSTSGMNMPQADPLKRPGYSIHGPVCLEAGGANHQRNGQISALLGL